MVKEKKNFKTSLLKSIKLQDSNAFLVKVNSFFFFKILKMCTSEKKS